MHPVSLLVVLFDAQIIPLGVVDTAKVA